MDCDLIMKNIEAYLDGELTLSDRRDFEEHISDCESCTGKLESMQAMQNMVRNTEYANMPSGLKNKIHYQLRDYTGEESNSSNMLNWLGISGGAMAIGALATWIIMSFLFVTPIQMRLADQIISSHVRSLMVNHVTDVLSSDRHTVKPWFNGKVDFSPPVKEFKSAGFELVGGRLDYIQARTVSALVYKRRAHLINAFIFRGEDSIDSVTPQHIQRQGYNLVHWISNGLEYWVISDLNRKELEEFARLLMKI